MKLRSSFVFTVICIHLCLTMPCAYAVCDGWPMYRGDAQCTARSTCFGPVEPAERWRFTTPGTVESPPLTSPNGCVYLYSSGYFYCLNLDGSRRWSKQVGFSEMPLYYPAALGSNGTVFLWRDMSILDARNPDTGDVFWSIDASIYNSGIVVDRGGTIYFQDSTGTRAVYPDSSNKWETQEYTSGHIVLSPDERVLYTYSSFGKSVTALDTASGSNVWNYMQPDFSPLHLVSAEDTVYLVNFDTVVAIDPTGFQGPSNRWILSVPGAGSRPALAGKKLFLMTTRSNCVAIADNGTHGEILWQTELPWNGDIAGAPIIVGDGTVCVVSAGILYGLDPADGSIMYAVTTPEGSPFMSQPSAGPDGSLYVGLMTGVCAIKEKVTTIIVEPFGGEFTISGTLGLQTGFTFPPGTFTDTISIEYYNAFTSTLPAFPAEGPYFAGRGFSLNGHFALTQTLPVTELQQPVTVTLSYNPRSIEGLDETTLQLRFWNGDHWSLNGMVTHGVYSDTHTVESTANHLSLFALTGDIPEAVCIYGIFGLVFILICRGRS